jgi:diaminopimelate epimerase
MIIDFVKTSPSQNTTVLITSFCPPERYVEVARKVMGYEYLHAEQVGFIVPPGNKNSVIGLKMAGGEFCGNASLSAAAYARYKGICEAREFLIDVSGADHPLRCYVEQKSRFVYKAKCEMPPPVSIREFTVRVGQQEVTGSVVNLKGISHFVFELWPEVHFFDDILELLENHINASALGVVPYRKINELEYEIKPYIHVRETDSRMFERGCGSGSLALGLHLKEKDITGKLNVRQPGGVIGVETGERNYIFTDVKVTCEGKTLLE